MNDSFSSSLDILEKDYDVTIRTKGELDERVFINEDSLVGSGSLSGGSIHTNGVKVCSTRANSILQKLYAFMRLLECIFTYNISSGE